MMTKRVVMLLICGMFLTMTCAFDAAEPAEAPNANTGSLSVAIAVPKSTSGNDDREVFAFNRNSHFHIVLTNTSDNIIRLPDTGNDWGRNALTFALVDEAGKTTLVHRPSIAVNGSIRPPTSRILEPHESMVLDIDFVNDDAWTGFPEMPLYGGSIKLQMRAVFEIKPDAVTRQKGFSTGRAESESDSFVFESRLSSGTSRGVGGVAESKEFGEILYHMENQGPDNDQRLKLLTISSNGKDMPIGFEALKGLHKPLPRTHQITTETGDDGRPMLYFSFELGETVEDNGHPTTPRVYFGFQDGKFVRRFTSILRRHIISEWQP